MSLLEVKCLCRLRAFDTQEDAERHLERVQARKLRPVMPTHVVQCTRGLWHLADPEPLAELARATELKPVSDKRKAENRLRRKIAHATFGRNPQCVAPGCTEEAWDCHEPLTRARGGSITDAANMAPLCRDHHDEITFEEPDWAYECGLLKHSWPGGEAS